MFDFEAARIRMIDGQLRTNDVTDHRVLRAFHNVPREAFVAKSRATLAYMDDDLPIGLGGDETQRFLIEPRVLGRMVQALQIGPRSSVLVVGCGSGYAAAIVAQLADSVIAVESDAELAETASRLLDDNDISNVAVVEGDLPAGYADQAPYDAILVDGAVPDVPETLIAQIAEGGRLAAIVGEAPYGSVRIYTRSAGSVSVLRAFDATAHPLPGFETPHEFVF